MYGVVVQPPGQTGEPLLLQGQLPMLHVHEHDEQAGPVHAHAQREDTTTQHRHRCWIHRDFRRRMDPWRVELLRMPAQSGTWIRPGVGSAIKQTHVMRDEK